MCRSVATLRMLMSWTPAHYTVHESRIGWRSPAIHRPSVQIHQSIRFPAGFCNISTWKASSGRNLKTNFTKPDGDDGDDKISSIYGSALK